MTSVFFIELVHIEALDGDFADGIAAAEQKAPEPHRDSMEETNWVPWPFVGWYRSFSWVSTLGVA